MIPRAIAIAVLSLAAGGAAAAELGRMFFTPEQRATLDKSRRQPGRGDAGDEYKPPAPPMPHDVSVTGLIRRSDGKYTIWLNNKMVSEHQKSPVTAGVGRRENHVRLRGPDSGRSVEVKVGQTLETVSGTIEENYARSRAAKTAPRAPVAAENSAPDVAKVIPPETREPVKSDTLARKRPTRDLNSDVVEESRTSRRMELR